MQILILKFKRIKEIIYELYDKPLIQVYKGISFKVRIEENMAKNGLICSW